MRLRHLHSRAAAGVTFLGSSEWEQEQAVPMADKPNGEIFAIALNAQMLQE
jgi:hypothetical protein